MNTREENVAAAMREAQEIAEREQVRLRDLKWAERWYQGDARCPRCGGTDFGIPDAKYEERARYESFCCISCSTRWRVELRETALIVLDDGRDDDWIELEMFEESSDVRFSERERATTIAALSYWRRERLANSGHERDIATAFDNLQPLSEEEIDALGERIAGPNPVNPALKT